jgi:Ca2+-binding RTX toxin-like protein
MAIVTGTDQSETLHGTIEADVITTGGGANTVIADAGNDTITSQGSVDTVLAGAGDDVIEIDINDALGYRGDLDGGEGVDTIRYARENVYQNGGVLDLAVTTAQGSYLRLYERGNTLREPYGSVTVHSIENVTGTEYFDIFYGNNNANFLSGLGSGDYLAGRGGNDTLLGGSGIDTVSGDDGDDLVDGGDGDDTLTGGAGNDSMVGGEGADRLDGGDGADTLNGVDSNWYYPDHLQGGQGDDRLVGDNRDTLRGGTGADHLESVTTEAYANQVLVSYIDSAQGMTINWQTGERTGDAAGDTWVNILRFELTNHADTYVGHSSGDYVLAGGGADWLRGSEGADTLYGQDGADDVDGGVGDDYLSGGDGNDVMNGGDGADTIFTGDGALDIAHGGAGNDYIAGADSYFGAGSDQLFGEEGDDHVSGVDGDDTLDGGSGNDIVDGGYGDDTIRGGAGNDRLMTGGGSVAPNERNLVDGGDGDDEINSSWGYNTLIGGAGNDTYRQVTKNAVVVEEADGGVDKVTLMGTEMAVYTIQENVEHAEVDGNNRENTITGNSLNNQIEGANWADIFEGMGGDDTLVGGMGSDTLRGGEGADMLIGDRLSDAGTDHGPDTLEGGAGDDIYYAGQSDTVVEAAGGGTDEVRAASSTYSLGENLENLSASWQWVSYNLTGNGGDNVITGFDAADTLTGGEGADTLNGRSGSDVLDGGAGSDTAYFDGNRADYQLARQADGSITVRDTRWWVPNAGTDTLTNVESLRFADTVIDATGPLDAFAKSDAITVAEDATTANLVPTLLANDNGGPGMSITGVDTTGTLGRVQFDAASQTLTYSADADAFDPLNPGQTAPDSFKYTVKNAAGVENTVTVVMTVEGRHEWIELTAGNDQESYGAGGQWIKAAAGHDSVSGGEGADTLEGEAGDDRLAGGAGADRLDGGDGQDTAVFEGARSAYTVARRQDGAFEVTDASGVTDVVMGVESFAFSDVTLSAADVLGAQAVADAVEVAEDATTPNLWSTLLGNDGGAGKTIVGVTTTGTLGTVTFDATTQTLTYSADSDSFDPLVPGESATDSFTYTMVDAAGVQSTATVTMTVQGRNEWIELTEGDDTAAHDLGNQWIKARAGSDTLSGGEGADTLEGEAGDDRLDGGAGADRLDGGDGQDTATYAGARGSYTIAVRPEGGFTVTAADGATDVVTGVETFVFSDVTLSAANLLGGEAKADTIEVAENATSQNLWSTLLSNDTGDGKQIVSVTTSGTLGSVVFDAQTQTLTYSANDETFEPLEPGQTAQDSFTYTMVDATGRQTTASVNVTVHGRDEWIQLPDTDDRESYGAGAQSVRGGAGNDQISGGEGDDQLHGQAGNDTLDGQAGSDVIDGGGGNDLIVGGYGDKELAGSYDHDIGKLDFSAAARGLAFSGADNQNGGSNVLGTLISGFEQVEFLGGAFADRIVGFTGADTLNGAGGNDVIDGGPGGGNLLDGGAGDDTIHIRNSDRVTGGVGRDRFILEADDNASLAGGGSAAARGFAAAPLGPVVKEVVLTDFSADDVLDISELLTDASDPFLSGLLRLEARGGDTVLVLNDGGDAVVVATFSGVQPAALKAANFSATAPDGTTVPMGVPTHTGTEGADQLEGSASADVMYGLGGDDLLRGNGGADTLVGGAGVDFLIGGAGDDSYYADRLEDVVIEAANAGRDTVIASSTFVLADNVENLTLVGEGDFEAHGNGMANVLRGNEGANRMFGQGGNDELFGGGGGDTLDGGAGADTLTGGSGDDVYLVQQTSDRIVEEGRGGHDRVESSVSFTLSANVEDLVLTGSSNINGTGNDEANRISGNQRDNRLDGGGGDDILDGGVGSDTLIGGAGADTLEGAQGTDRLEGGEGADSLFGGEARDTLLGGDGDDVLEGGAGPDSLVGGAGDDTLVVDDMADVVSEAAGGGIDTVIQKAAEHRLAANVEHLTMSGPVATRGYGNSLDNRLTGSDGDNILDGGAGADTLAGGGGSDWLVGGAGADVFVFGQGSGKDTISDFQIGVDRLDVRALGEYSVSATGSGTVLSFQDGSSIILTGVTSAPSDSWFV